MSLSVSPSSTEPDREPPPVVELYPGAASRPPIRQPDDESVRRFLVSVMVWFGALIIRVGRSVSRARTTRSVGSGLHGARRRVQQSVPLHPEAGTSTAEYAIATLAAVAFAGLLVVIMRSDEVRGFLMNIIQTALQAP